MIKQENYISLKEASKITGYSPDYIGQLIRGGKISGRQVYTNISWVTTADAVLAYKAKKDNKIEDSGGVKDYILAKKRKFAMELDVLMLFFKTFKSILPILLVLAISFFILVVILLNSLTPKNNLINTTSFKEMQNEFSF